MMRKTAYFGLFAGFALSVASVHAAEAVKMSEPFATAGSDLSAYEKWSGFGSVVEAEKTAGVVAPIEDSNGNVLSVDGSVTAAAETDAGKPAIVEMMVQVAKPDEDLALPSGETDPIQIALGVETDGTLKVYCAPKTGGNGGWNLLGATVYEEGTWLRVTFRFDYTNNRCQICVNGEPMLSAAGSFDAAGLSQAATGSWYRLVTDDKTNLASVKIIGSTKIDDVLVKNGDSLSEVVPGGYQPVTGDDGIQVPQSWFVEQGITSGTSAAGDGSGLTVGQKYAAGLNVADGEKPAIKAVTTAPSGVVLTVPAANPPVDYENRIVITSSDGSAVDPVTIPANATTVTAPAPAPTAGAGAVKYTYEIKTVAK